MIDAVVKIGGSLSRGNHLRALCREVGTLGRRHGLLIVPGGGAFADTVRRYHARFALSETAAHWMAILAMDQYGYLLAELVPGSSTVRSLEEARACAENGSVPVLLPFGLVRQGDTLPHSWEVTSDSISVWVAALAGASMVVLLKDRKGSGGRLDETAQLPPGTATVQQSVAWEGVDGYLAHLLEDIPVELWILNGEQPERLTELLTTGRTQGVRLLPSMSSAGAQPPDPPGRSRGLLGTPPNGRL